MLHVVLTLDGRTDIVVELVPNKHFQSISFGESFDYFGPVLPCALWQVACDAKIKRPIRSVCLNVNPAAAHAESLKTWMAGTSPAMTA
jgi:hypothetical protein